MLRVKAASGRSTPAELQGPPGAGLRNPFGAAPSPRVASSSTGGGPGEGVGGSAGPGRDAKRLRGQLGIAVRNGDFAAGLEGWLVQGGCEVVPWLGRQAVLMKRRGSMVQLIGQPPKLTGERSLLLSFEVTCCCTKEGGNPP